MLMVFASVTNSTKFYEDCGIEKGCFGTPDNCIETKNCQVAFSHKKISEEEFEFQLISDEIHSDEYIAVRLSQDQFMRNDAVIACTTAFKPEVLAHWNFYYWAVVLEDPKSNIA